MSKISYRSLRRKIESILNIRKVSISLFRDGIPQIKRLFVNCIPTLLALAGFFLLCGFVLYVRGQNPLEFYSIIFVNGFTSFDDFGYVLFNATPLVFTGLAVTIGYKSGLFNIGCEGVFHIDSALSIITRFENLCQILVGKSLAGLFSLYIKFIFVNIFGTF